MTKKVSVIVKRFTTRVDQLGKDFDKIVSDMKGEAMYKADYDAIEKALWNEVDGMYQEAQQL